MVVHVSLILKASPTSLPILSLRVVMAYRPLVPCLSNLDWYSHYGEQCGDPAIPLLGIHTKETRIERDTCTPMFIAALYNSQDMEAT